MNENKLAFYCDLDLTLIYSKRTLKKYHSSPLGKIVVESHGTDIMSFVSMETWHKFTQLVGQGMVFIPTTTRTYEQYSRVHIPGINPEYAIVLSGGQIFYQGEEIPEWREHVASEIGAMAATPKQIYQKYAKTISEVPGVNKIRGAEGFFLYAVKDEAENPELFELFQEISTKYGYIVSHQGRKSYLMPPCVDKGKAVAFLNEIVKPTHSASAGDSVLDLSMGGVTDTLFIPAHGEAASLGYGGIITPQRGIGASEDIMDALSEMLK